MDVRGRYLQKKGYVLVLRRGHPRADRNGCVKEHILVVETAMGKPVRAGAEVHHVNEIKSDNRNGNLVACDSAAYHKLLHVRQRALDACGNANWRACRFCKKYDAVANLSITPKCRSGEPYHRSCAAARARQRKAAIA